MCSGKTTARSRRESRQAPPHCSEISLEGHVTFYFLQSPIFAVAASTALLSGPRQTPLLSLVSGHSPCLKTLAVDGGDAGGVADVGAATAAVFLPTVAGALGAAVPAGTGVDVFGGTMAGPCVMARVPVAGTDAVPTATELAAYAFVTGARDNAVMATTNNLAKKATFIETPQSFYCYA
jgi:hypothetical protein